MSLSSRVAWTEGLFLRPQHFQQEARYNDRLFKSGLLSAPRGWGFHELSLNEELLQLGKIALSRAVGIMPDGEVFDAPAHDLMPEPIDLPENRHGCDVHFCLPHLLLGQPETSNADDATRRRTLGEMIPDLATEGRNTPAAVEIAPLRPLLKVEPMPGAGVERYLSTPVARIADVASSGAIKLDTNFIPTVLRFEASGVLQQFATLTLGLIEGRAKTLAARVTGATTTGAAETSDYILLQALNRYVTLFRQITGTGDIHPQVLHQCCLDLCSELAVHTQPDRLVPNFPPYRHADLTESFKPVFAEVRRSLSFIGDPTATRLPMTERAFGIRVAEVQDRSLLSESQVVLAVGADMAGEDIRRRFPNEAKIGSVEVIRDLVNIQLPGVRLKALPVAPRQIPYHAEKVYFDLERAGEYWEPIVKNGALALHVGGDFPGLDLKLWAIREARR